MKHSINELYGNFRVEICKDLIAASTCIKGTFSENLKVLCTTKKDVFRHITSVGRTFVHVKRVLHTARSPNSFSHSIFCSFSRSV